MKPIIFLALAFLSLNSAFCSVGLEGEVDEWKINQSHSTEKLHFACGIIFDSRILDSGFASFVAFFAQSTTDDEMILKLGEVKLGYDNEEELYLERVSRDSLFEIKDKKPFSFTVSVTKNELNHRNQMEIKIPFENRSTKKTCIAEIKFKKEAGAKKVEISDRTVPKGIISFGGGAVLFQGSGIQRLAQGSYPIDLYFQSFPSMNHGWHLALSGRVYSGLNTANLASAVPTYQTTDRFSSTHFLGGYSYRHFLTRALYLNYDGGMGYALSQINQATTNLNFGSFLVSQRLLINLIGGSYNQFFGGKAYVGIGVGIEHSWLPGLSIGNADSYGNEVGLVGRLLFGW